MVHPKVRWSGSFRWTAGDLAATVILVQKCRQPHGRHRGHHRGGLHPVRERQGEDAASEPGDVERRRETPVYIGAATSVSARSTIGAGSLPRSSSAKFRPSTITGAGRSPTASVTVGSSSGVVTTAVATESVTMCCSSRAVTRKITGVTTAPIRQTAW
jgi:hypothetical protein